MSLLEQKELNKKSLLKILKKSIKKIILENGIEPNTKKGNKELNYLLKEIAKSHFSSFEQVQAQGEKIGQLIVKLSNERGKIALDHGIIQHIILKEDLSLSDEVEEEDEINPTHTITVEVAEIIDKDEEEEEKIIISPVAEVEENKQKEDEPIKAVETTTPSSISLKDRIGEDIKNAMKAQDKIRLETVRGIKKFIIEKEVSLRPSGQDSLTPEQEIEVLTQQAKQRRDSIEQYTKAGREDLAEKEAQELAIIETYLPKQLTDEELTEIIDDIIVSVGATSAKDLGKVMGVAMKQLKGKADGKKIQELVKSQLS
ncbi:GatB/YqeY domain-containing protein [Aphanothece hegewaldii]|uniref:GatB/YqeY domain-containing protein n=1 Tax=Aphanothece hegewaldii TaxID=1521625 RepID=UPI001C634465|nr:GatB/YqeY domain-containing protein [Aphanothece hegewaldii]